MSRLLQRGSQTWGERRGSELAFAMTVALTHPARHSASAGRTMGCGNRLGLRRAALAQDDGEHHQREDGQELALPVLEGLKPELTRAQELQRREGVSPMSQLLLIELTRSTDG